MTKLPVNSGVQCVKALKKIGFVVYRQRGSHIVMIRKIRQRKLPYLITRNSTAARCEQSFAMRD